ncbi:hypothetical protein [Micrococcus terreus]|uniref:hypothetical protein n=1 Tax=Micrococcus terreus TaxID=574650 RepID=UPI0023FA2EFE|nr:hypothetical protein [Micrococcus terreus]
MSTETSPAVCGFATGQPIQFCTDPAVIGSDYCHDHHVIVWHSEPVHVEPCLRCQVREPQPGWDYCQPCLSIIHSDGGESV